MMSVLSAFSRQSDASPPAQRPVGHDPAPLHEPVEHRAGSRWVTPAARGSSNHLDMAAVGQSTEKLPQDYRLKC